MTCAFFGHRVCPQNTATALRDAVVDLIENKGVRDFYMGNQGDFDRLARETLRTLQQIYPDIRYTVVLAYFPTKGANLPENTVFPEELERVPPRYAINRRNKWILDRADYVITFVRSAVGGAATFDALAEEKGKTLIRL